MGGTQLEQCHECVQSTTTITVSRTVELAVVLPTFNERRNIEPLLDKLSTALRGIAYELIFVDDDSPDGTGTALRAIARTNPRVRVLRRIGRRGLSSACLEGMLSTAAPYIAVMDADLQHDETILPVMLSKIKSGRCDLVVATRNRGPGGMGDLASSRVRLSKFACRLSRLLCQTDLTDPLSGFFLVRAEFLDEVVHGASGVGFKILLDLVASARRPIHFDEVPYTIRKRVYGKSKLDMLVAAEYLYLLLRKKLGQMIPA